MPYQPPVTYRQPPRPQPAPQPRPEPAKPAKAKPREVEFAPPDALGVILNVDVPEPGALGIELK